MKISNSSSPDIIKRVSYHRTLYTGRNIEETIEANISSFDDEPPTIIIHGTNLQLQDVPEFIKAVELAAMIASGELEIE